MTGSVEKGESLDKAALREAEEETGLSFSGYPQSVGRPFQFESRGSQVVEYGFLIMIVSKDRLPPRVRLDPHEHDDYRWVSADEALKLICFASNSEVLISILQQLKSSNESS